MKSFHLHVMIHCIYLVSTGMINLVVLCLLTCLTGSYGQSGTYFVQQDSVFNSYSSWIITITVDLDPYEQQMAVLTREIKQFSDALMY